MDPVTVETTIARPREEVFAYLRDVANHPEFTDHFLKDWHLTREQSAGAGAGARFRVDAPLTRFGWADTTLTDVQEPYLIAQHGRGGKFNRIRQRGEFRLNDSSGGTRVEWTLETLPVLPSDRMLELVAGRAWWKRQLGRSLRRLRAILEEDRERGLRASVAAG